jgi:hypothetical protein
VATREHVADKPRDLGRAGLEVLTRRRLGQRNAWDWDWDVTGEPVGGLGRSSEQQRTLPFQSGLAAEQFVQRCAAGRRIAGRLRRARKGDTREVVHCSASGSG